MGLTCPSVTYLSDRYDNLCELKKCIMIGLADRRAHASTLFVFCVRSCSGGKICQAPASQAKKVEINS